MKKIIYLLIITVTIIGCKSADENLTEEEWILEIERASYDISTDNETDTTIYYKKSDRELVLNFDIDGTVDVTEKNGDRFGDASWRWIDKKSIKMSVRGNDLDYHIKVDDKMTISSTDFENNSRSYLVLRKSSDEDRLNDMQVDGFNKSKSHQQ